MTTTVDRRTVLLTALAAGFAAKAQTGPPGANDAGPDPTETLDLWPEGAPGMPAAPPAELVTERSTDPDWPDRAVVGITRPRLVVFRPAHANGAAVMVTPGGAYSRVVIDKEGYELGRWLAARGYTVFVLFYRLPGEGWAAGPDVTLADTQRAMRLIREQAPAYGVDPERVAAMGFSAGGHACADLATRFSTRTYDPVDAADRHSAKPMVAAAIYPVISMLAPIAHPVSREKLIGSDADATLERAHSPHLNVPDDAPPCFLVHAEDDASVDVANTLQFRAALRAAGIAVETHLFTEGGHGFGLRRAAGKPAEIWPQLFINWAGSRGLA